ncbi:8-amino-7-oxononanoate synthase [Desulfuromonas sp. AOP6]|uniref:8-amino-7-oxononanoate synthase n=1 Tax=Desulfuromonas sp. AOP6 TaxID=1566351 RepID=UPI0012787923|nr:8-amino-7-oxononanoate synthase [Desulfuromonas sp. AOP6]BCA79411.1 8-amino-7-oxononanoate synthase [Desulfuromonas sp. AOP6]
MSCWTEELEILKKQDMFRALRTVDSSQGTKVLLAEGEVLLLCSNNYLGLASHPALIEAAAKAVRDWGAGTGGSRLISGSMTPHAQLEEKLAAFKGTEAALLFNSGYAANTGLLQGLFGPDDVIFSDALNHASIVDGCRLSKARTVIYPHGDAAALECLLSREEKDRQGRWVIVTDGVFSMDGDVAPLVDLVRLKKRYNALLMVDDAHGTGVLGEGGRGTAEHLGCLEEVDLHMGTLGKALGCFGAYVAADRVIVDTLINRSRSFIFSTSLPPSIPASAMAALDIVQSVEGESLRLALWSNRALFAERLQRGGLSTGESTTQIVPVLTGEPAPTMKLAQSLLTAGIFVQGIRPPTVPAGNCRLRATLMATHAPGDLERAADLILQAMAGVFR